MSIEKTMFYIAAFLLVVLGIAHSYLGERYILIRLFRREDLPKTLGSDEFTKRTLRFAWHITTVAWLGFALILIHLAGANISKEIVATIISLTFLAHGFIALIGSKAKHLSWVFFLIIGLTTIYAANT